MNHNGVVEEGEKEYNASCAMRANYSSAHRYNARAFPFLHPHNGHHFCNTLKKVFTPFSIPERNDAVSIAGASN